MLRGKCFPFFSLRWYSSCERRSHFSFSQTLRPPVPKKIPSTVSAHGASWHDPYRWMCNTNDPDLSDYLTRENAYAGAFMADTADLRQTLEAEMKSRIPSSKVSTPPERWGPWLYYQYIPEGKEYPILCRRLTSYNGVVKSFFNYMRSFPNEEILLDWNLIAEQHGYVHIGICRVSPDHKYLAYTLDTSGQELFTLHVKDLGSGYTVSHKRVGVVSLAWSRTSNFLVYTACDETQRPNRVFCKELGSDVEDNVLFVESGQGFCVDVANTKDRSFITINSNSRSSSEERLFPIDLCMQEEFSPTTYSQSSFISGLRDGFDKYKRWIVLSPET